MNPSITLIRSALLAAAVAAVSPAQAYSSLIVFGDSLSDTGNVQARANLAGLDVPAEPYFQDRFTNGPVAVEVMAQALAVPLTSYAYGGATTGLGNRIPAGNLLDGTGMQSQVNQFIAGLGGAQADAQALYVLWGGGNDLFTLLENPSADPSAVFAEAVGNLSNQLGQLYASGARDFFVPLLPDFGYTYEAIMGGPAVQAGVSALSASFNSSLSSAMQLLQGSLADADIRLFDTAATQISTRASLLAQGGNLTDRCWTGDYDGTGGTLCADPDRYFLFDSVHPTAVVHRATGLAMAAAVPEPKALMLLMAGLLPVAAGALRRRKTLN